MSLPRVALSDQSPAFIACDALIVGIAPGPDGSVEISGDAFGPDHKRQLGSQASTLSLATSMDDAHVLPAPDGVEATKVILVGLGSDSPTPDTLRHAAGVAVRTAGKNAHIAIALPSAGPQSDQAIVEGALLGGYRVTARKKPSTDPEWETLTVVGATDPAAIHTGLSTAQAVAFVRDLVNTPPNELYPESFSQRVADALAGVPVSIEVFNEDQLAEGGFGGLLGVGGGSARPPRLVALRYQPEQALGHIALIGKGITFDSGGLSLKPPSSMVGMKYDMTGAATVAGVILAAATLGSPVAITAWLCLAENMPSGTAQRPGDVITIRGGTTVEVLNTDAEGRLVLADGLQAASEESPDLLIDIATLTGAARIALGERYAGLMGHEAARAVVAESAQRAGELVWPMPLPDELRTGLKSDVADIANVATGSTLGGMLVAGLFLEEFVGTTGEGDDQRPIPWAHLDIAGPASNSSSPWGYTPKGPTGALTRSLIELVRGLDAEGIARLRQ